MQREEKKMYKIGTLNKISPVGLARFTDDYTVTENIDEANGIILRSYNMHEMDLSENLLAGLFSSVIGCCCWGCCCTCCCALAALFINPGIACCCLDCCGEACCWGCCTCCCTFLSHISCFIICLYFYCIFCSCC